MFDRYVELARNFGEIVPQSFLSRSSTFKEKLSGFVGGIYQFYQPLHVDVENRQMLLIPIKYQFTLVSEAVTGGFNPTERLCDTTRSDNPFIDIVHTGLKIHGDMNAMSGHKGLDISEDAAKKIVPESLFMLLSLLIRGQSSLDEMLDSEEEIEDDENCEDDDSGPFGGNRRNYFDKKILSIAQDIIYVASKGKKLTPKHIGLGLALHQKTRSRKLINLFNSAGHCVTYSKVLQIDNTLADLTLSTIDHTTGSVVPPHFQSAEIIKHENQQLLHEPILQITADNIDIIADTLDGKNSFHGTQVVAFQRGASSSSASILSEIEMKPKVAFRIPAVLSRIPPEPTLPPFSPNFAKPIITDWYKRDVNVTESVKNAKAMDMSFLICRQNELESNYTGWTEFNQRTSRDNHQVTTQGYLPLILNPAHEHSTLLLFLQRAVSLADSLRYRYYSTLL